MTTRSLRRPATTIACATLCTAHQTGAACGFSPPLRRGHAQQRLQEPVDRLPVATGQGPLRLPERHGFRHVSNVGDFNIGHSFAKGRAQLLIGQQVRQGPRVIQYQRGNVSLQNAQPACGYGNSGGRRFEHNGVIGDQVPHRCQVFHGSAADQYQVRVAGQLIDERAQGFRMEVVLCRLVNRIGEQADSVGDACLQRLQGKALGTVRFLEHLRQSALRPGVQRQRQRPEVGVEVDTTDIAAQPAREMREKRGNGVHAHALAMHQHHLARLNLGPFLLLADRDDLADGAVQIAGIEGFGEIQEDAAPVQVVRQNHVVLRPRGQYDAFRPADLQKRCNVRKGILLAVEVHEHDVGRPRVPAGPRGVSDRAPVDLCRWVDTLDDTPAVHVVQVGCEFRIRHPILSRRRDPTRTVPLVYPCDALPSPNRPRFSRPYSSSSPLQTRTARSTCSERSGPSSASSFRRADSDMSSRTKVTYSPSVAADSQPATRMPIKTATGNCHAGRLMRVPRNPPRRVDTAQQSVTTAAGRTNPCIEAPIGPYSPSNSRPG